MQCTLCYSRCIALDFQLLQLAPSTDQGLIFYETRMNHLNGQHLLSSAINKKKGKHGKYSVEVSSGKYNT